jgi:hypothetical protein
MAQWTFTGTVWHDHNGDGIREPGDDGVTGVGVTVTTFAGGTLEQSVTVTTAADGTWSASMLAFPSGSAVIAVDVGAAGPFQSWRATTSNPLSLDLSAAPGGGTFAGNDFGIQPAKQCFTAWSSWVYEVCWLPGRGVAVTFKDRAGAPCFRCYYPGTTFDDYQWYRVQVSLGKWEWAVYYRRPYVPLPLGAE